MTTISRCKTAMPTDLEVTDESALSIVEVVAGNRTRI